MSVTDPDSEARLAALYNAVSSIDTNALLPGQVFVGDWSEHRFFQSDWMLAGSFVETVASLIRLENSRYCCLVNIRQALVDDSYEAATYYLDQTVTAGEYEARLRLGGSAKAWLYSMSRYVCSSDKGDWSIYSEAQNEIAVIALRGSLSTESAAAALDSVHAQSIEKLLNRGSSAMFPFNRLVPEWCVGLARNYNT